jgi:AcrR family transcriptional regulator
MTTSESSDVRERILDEAANLFVARGYHGISMREIAEAVGVSKAGLYYHFRDKEALFLAILTANLEATERLICEARSAGPTARDQIGAIVRAIFAQAPDQRAIIRLASQEMAHISQAARAEFGRLYQEKFLGQLEAVLREGIAAGEVRSMDVGTATWILLGMMYPFFYPGQQREPDAPQGTIDLIVTLFFEGAARRG